MNHKVIISTIGIVVSMVFIFIGLNYNKYLFLALIGYILILIFSIIYGLFHKTSIHIPSIKEDIDIEYPYLSKKIKLSQLPNLPLIMSSELSIRPTAKGNYMTKDLMDSNIFKNSDILLDDYFQDELYINFENEKKGMIDDDDLCMYI